MTLGVLHAIMVLLRWVIEALPWRCDACAEGEFLRYAATYMHIGIDARLVYYTRAGIGEYTLRLTQALAKAYSHSADRFTLLQDRRNSPPLVDAW